MTITRHICKRNRILAVVLRDNDADRRFEPMRARFDFSHVAQRDDRADHAMPAHAEIADIVEEDYAGRATRIARRTEQGAYHHVRAARLVNNGGAMAIEFVAKALAPFGERTAA